MTISYATLDRFPFHRFGSDGTIWRFHKDQWRQCRCNPGSNGRLNVTINNATQSAARLICEAFHGPCPNGMECCHNNGERTDNRESNLRWDTRSANHLDKRQHGTDRAGELNPSAKVSNADAAEIRRAYWAGEMTQCELAATYSITQASVWGIVHRKTYACV